MPEDNKKVIGKDVSDNPDTKDYLKSVFEDKDVLSLYANSFVFHLTHSDACIILKLNGVNHAVINLSHNNLKDLAGLLSQGIERFEELSGTPMIGAKEMKEKILLGKKKSNNK